MVLSNEDPLHLSSSVVRNPLSAWFLDDFNWGFGKWSSSGVKLGSFEVFIFISENTVRNLNNSAVFKKGAQINNKLVTFRSDLGLKMRLRCAAQ